MKRFFIPPLCVLSLSHLAATQDADVSSKPGLMVFPEGACPVDCQNIADAFDVESAAAIAGATSANGILGVAHDQLTGKWFFSNRDGGVNAQTIVICDSNAVGFPVASTARLVPQSPNIVSSLWGTRDMEWDPIGGMVYMGDEAQTIHEFDPVSEGFTGVAWNCSGSTSTTLRAIAVENTGGNLFVYFCDFGTNIEKWLLQPGGGQGILVNGNVALNPGGTYGMTHFDSDNDGVQDALAIYGQIQYLNCIGVGLSTITIVDPVTGNVLADRAGDITIPGTAPNIEGGIAGGIQATTVSGQPILAHLAQAAPDSCGFVPYGGFSRIDYDCGSAYLILECLPGFGQMARVRVTGNAPPMAKVLVSLCVPGTIVAFDFGTLFGHLIPAACGTWETCANNMFLWTLFPGESSPLFPCPTQALGPSLLWDAIEYNLPSTFSSTNSLRTQAASRCW